MPNFDEISQSTAEIKLLPLYENGRPPYWKSICGSDFDLCIVIGMSFCIYLPNRIYRTTVGGVMTSYRKRLPDGATTDCGGEHVIAAYYSFIDPERMKG